MPQNSYDFIAFTRCNVTKNLHTVALVTTAKPSYTETVSFLFPAVAVTTAAATKRQSFLTSSFQEIFSFSFFALMQDGADTKWRTFLKKELVWTVWIWHTSTHKDKTLQTLKTLLRKKPVKYRDNEAQHQPFIMLELDVLRWVWEVINRRD